jgi:hypothetical protein
VNGNMAPKSIVVGVADLVPLGGRQNPGRCHWRAFWDASGVLTAGMQAKDACEQGRSIRFKRKFVGPDKPTR